MSLYSAFNLISLTLVICSCSTVASKVEKDLKELPLPIPEIDMDSSSSNCDKLDWYGLGQEEGIKGKELTPSMQEKIKTCDYVSPEQKDLFWHGWNEGIAEYCSEANGFALGQVGQTYSRICPEGIMEKFDKSYQQGLRVFLMEKQNQKLTVDLKKLKKNLNENEITELKKQLTANNRSIQEIKQKFETQN